MGESTLATKDKANAYKFKDYVMEEDFAGNIEIMKKGDDVAEDVFMSYKVDDVPVKGKKGSTKVEEYEEYTARPDAEGNNERYLNKVYRMKLYKKEQSLKIQCPSLVKHQAVRYCTNDR